MGQLVRRLADAHEDEADPALLGRPVRERQRDALAVLIDTQDQELARASLLRKARGIDSHLEDGVGKLTLVDDLEHASPSDTPVRARSSVFEVRQVY